MRHKTATGTSYSVVCSHCLLLLLQPCREMLVTQVPGARPATQESLGSQDSRGPRGRSGKLVQQVTLVPLGGRVRRVHLAHLAVRDQKESQ